jgi:hypothetical protein
MVRLALSFALLCVVSSNAMAQAGPPPMPSLFSGTPEEQRACRPDATRFCSAQIPDNLAVLGCLQRNRTKLRKECLAVLQRHGQ